MSSDTRFDWTRRSNRGTSGTTGSVRRSIEAVTEGLKLPPSGLHLPPPARQPTAIQSFGGALGGSARRAFERVATAAERLYNFLPTPANSNGTISTSDQIFRSFW